MTDKLSPAARSENMRRIRSRDTKPELAVRRLLHGLGYRFRIHRRDLPGKPDLVFSARRKVIFVHGCFWHGHDDDACPDRRAVKSNSGYWVPKIAGNIARDERHEKALRDGGWEVAIVWECQMRQPDRVRAELVSYLGPAQL